MVLIFICFDFTNFGFQSRFSITVLWIGSAAGVNDPVILLKRGTKVHHIIRDKNLVTRYGLAEESCGIPKNPEYMGCSSPR